MKKKVSVKGAGYSRGARGVKRTQFHILLTAKERAQLKSLSVRLELNAADVVRRLIAAAHG